MRPVSDNPKDALARRTKVPLQLVPAIGAVEAAFACKDGVDKGYGAYNWRERPIGLMEYIGALERHIARLKDGENFDGDSPNGASHLGCIVATASIVLDAQGHGTLIDDRPARAQLGNADGPVSRRLNSTAAKA